MPAPSDAERPRAARAVARRYLRRERPLGALVAALAVAVLVSAYLATSPLPAAVVGAVLIVLLRAPVLRSRGTVRLRTDDSPDAVRAAFAGPTPPVLALQWGIADEVTAGDGTATYRTSYLLGLRSVELTVRARTGTTPEGDHRVELEITEGDGPWATYTSTISDAGGRTVVDVEYASTRRFGARRLPQWLLAERYRADALSAQGYAVVERDVYIGP